MNTREILLDTKTLKDAMISKDTVRLGVVRNLKSEIQRTEGGKTTMNENQIVNLIKKDIENTRSNKNDGWELEVEVLESFLPKQMTKDEISTIIDGFIGNGLNSIGPIMGRFSKEFAGKADGGLVSTIVKEKLGIG